MSSSRAPSAARPAFAFVLTMGVVNLFADMTYEGGASINGQFLGSLGASAAAVGIIAGARAGAQRGVMTFNEIADVGLVAPQDDRSSDDDSD